MESASGVFVGVGVGAGVGVGVGDGACVGSAVTAGVCVGNGSRGPGQGLHRCLDTGLNGGPDVGRRHWGFCRHRLRNGRLDDGVYVRSRLSRRRLRATGRQEEGRSDQGEARQRSAPGAGVRGKREAVEESEGCAHTNLLLLDPRHTGLSYLHGAGVAGVHADLAELYPATLHELADAALLF